VKGLKTGFTPSDFEKGVKGKFIIKMIYWKMAHE